MPVLATIATAELRVTSCQAAPCVWHAPSVSGQRENPYAGSQGTPRIETWTAHTAELDAATLRAARSLLDAVFGREMTEHDWEHAVGGAHAGTARR